MLKRRGSQSMKMHRAPAYETVLAVAMKVIAGTSTSSPGPIPHSFRATCRQAVPLIPATAYLEPEKSATLRSKRPT
jgi:hypothetical protein